MSSTTCPFCDEKILVKRGDDINIRLQDHMSACPSMYGTGMIEDEPSFVRQGSRYSLRSTNDLLDDFNSSSHAAAAAAAANSSSPPPPDNIRMTRAKSREMVGGGGGGGGGGQLNRTRSIEGAAPSLLRMPSNTSILGSSSALGLRKRPSLERTNSTERRERSNAQAMAAANSSELPPMMMRAPTLGRINSLDGVLPSLDSMPSFERLPSNIPSIDRLPSYSNLFADLPPGPPTLEMQKSWEREKKRNTNNRHDDFELNLSLENDAQLRALADAVASSSRQLPPNNNDSLPSFQPPPPPSSSSSHPSNDKEKQNERPTTKRSSSQTGGTLQRKRSRRSPDDNNNNNNNASSNQSLQPPSMMNSLSVPNTTTPSTTTTPPPSSSSDHAESEKELHRIRETLSRVFNWVPAAGTLTENEKYHNEFVAHLLSAYRNSYSSFHTVLQNSAGSGRHRTKFIRSLAIFLIDRQLSSHHHSSSSRPPSPSADHSNNITASPSRPTSPSPSAISNQRRHKIIRHSSDLPQKLYSLQHSLVTHLTLLLHTIADILLLNVLEVLSWAIYIDRLEGKVLTKDPITQIRLLSYCGYAVKLIFTDDSPFINSVLSPSSSSSSSSSSHHHPTTPLGAINHSGAGGVMLLPVLTGLFGGEFNNNFSKWIHEKQESPINPHPHPHPLSLAPPSASSTALTPNNLPLSNPSIQPITLGISPPLLSKIYTLFDSQPDPAN